MDKDKPKGLFGGLSGEEKKQLKETHAAALEQKVQMAAQTEALKTIAEAVKGGSQKIEITLNLKMLEEILGDVKDLKKGQEVVLRLLRGEGRIIIKLKGENLSVKGERVMVDFKKVGQFVDFELEILDAKGRKAAIDGDVVVANSDDTVGTVTYDQTARTGRLTCAGEGIGHVDFTCDARIGPDVKPLVGVLDYTGPDLTEASVFNVKVGEVQDPVV